MNEEEIKVAVLKEIDKTKKLIVEYTEANLPIPPDSAIGRLSRMDAINNQSIAASALRQAQLKLKNLERVKSQINEADFGLCLSCRKPIPLGRILIRPESLRCVNCAN